MSAPVILVTAVCGDLGASTVRALARESYRLIGTDINPYCPVTEFLDAFEVIPPAGAPAYLERLLAICETKKVQVILPLSEPEILSLNTIREVFEQRGICLALNSEYTLSTFFDKFRTVQHIASLGYAVPKTILLEDGTTCLPLPFIVKPRRGCGSRGIAIVDTKAAYDYFKQRHKSGFIVQELIGNDNHEYTTGIFSDGNHTASITFRRILSKGGYSQEVHLVSDDHIKALAVDLAASIKLEGSINIQTRKVDGIHIPFEINPRLSSSVMFRTLAGFCDAHWWLQHLLYKRSFTYTPLNQPFVGVRHIVEKVFS